MENFPIFVGHTFCESQLSEVVFEECQNMVWQVPQLSREEGRGKNPRRGLSALSWLYPAPICSAHYAADLAAAVHTGLINQNPMASLRRWRIPRGLTRAPNLKRHLGH